MIIEIRDIKKWSDKMKSPLIKLYTEEGLQKMWNDWCDAMQDIYKSGGDICKNYVKDISSPTFVLHGDKDPMVLPEHPEYLLKNIKNIKYVLYTVFYVVKCVYVFMLSFLDITITLTASIISI